MNGILLCISEKCAVWTNLDSTGSIITSEVSQKEKISEWFCLSFLYKETKEEIRQTPMEKIFRDMELNGRRMKDHGSQ